MDNALDPAAMYSIRQAALHMQADQKASYAAERCSRLSTPIIGHRLTQPLKSTTISFPAPGPEPSPGFDISRGMGVAISGASV
ncbi:hypothetical protein N7467_007044 [Penicillium canescens]|nr:hypothetical protein N7467_007044 [Penicillium canescens]